jgi:GNAT superfamily N-acetyltransferase
MTVSAADDTPVATLRRVRAEVRTVTGSGGAGALALRRSHLDSQRFGIPIARIDGVDAADVPTLVTRCLDDGLEMVIARCPADDFTAVHALERAGCLLMETLVEYRGPVAPAPASPLVREASTDDLDAVVEVAREAFSRYAGHYHADPRLPAAECTELYADWAGHCVTGEAAENVVVAELDGEIVGFQAHTTAAPGTGQLLLVCVSPQARGRGVYRALGAYAQRWSAARGLGDLIAVCHQANLASHRIFIGLGLRPARITNTFHGWRDDLSPRAGHE